MPRSIVVTGAAGFLGSWCIKLLLERGWQVTAFDRTDSDDKLRAIAGDAAADGVAWQAGDIADTATVNALFEAAQPETVIHLAAVLIPACKADPVNGAMIDVVGHINVFEAAIAAGCRHVVYASSAAARARADDGALNSVYGTFKLWNEEYAATRLRDRGMPSVGLRPAIVYGPGREAGATAFVNAAISAAVRGEPYTLPMNWRHRVEYVEEVAEAFVLCAEADVAGAVTSDITTDVTGPDELLAAIAKTVPGAAIAMPPEGRYRSAGAADTAGLEGLLGPRSHVGLDDGVARTVALMRGEATGGG